MATIWRVTTVADLRPLFTSAGLVDQAVVQAHLATLRADQQPPVPREAELPRWFYLYTQDPRVVLRTITMSLEHWEGPAKVLIGTFIHIGEFAGTRSLANRQVKGVRITLEPIEMLRGAPQRFFSDGQALLQGIDWAVLDDQQRWDLHAHRSQ